MWSIMRVLPFLNLNPKLHTSQTRRIERVIKAYLSVVFVKVLFECESIDALS